MRPGGAFLFSEARDALHPGGTTIQHSNSREQSSLPGPSSVIIVGSVRAGGTTALECWSAR